MIEYCGSKNKQKVHLKYYFDQDMSVPWQGPADSLGISIAGGVGSPLGDVPIFIAMMHPNGVAAQTQKLRVSFPATRVGLGNLASVSTSRLATDGRWASRFKSAFKYSCGWAYFK